MLKNNYACEGNIVAWLLLLLASSCQAATWHVVPPGTPITPASPYHTWTNASTNLIAIALASASGDTILVSNGTYILTNEIVINDKAVLMCSWHDGTLDPTGTVLQSDGNYRCLYFRGASAGITPIVAGFTFANGNGYGSVGANQGGGVRIGNGEGNSGIFSNCVVVSNYATSSGGGVYCWGTNILVTDCIIANNIVTSPSTAVCGGGIYIRSGKLARCRIYNNTNTFIGNGGDGGGLYIYGTGITNITISECIITNNTATRNGGGIFGDYLSNTVFISNQVCFNSAGGNGGGISVELYSSNFYIFNCNIISNSATTNGGGISVRGTMHAIISNCFIANNSAAGGGGGYFLANSSTTNYIYIKNTTFSENCATSSSSISGGGGIYMRDFVFMENCFILGNHADNGFFGGIFNYSAGYNFGKIRNTLFAYNTAATNAAFGTKVPNTNTIMQFAMENCTIVSNQATQIGGGLYIFLNNDKGLALFRNLICISNSAPSNPNWQTTTTNYQMDFSCTSPTNGLNGTGNIEADPLFAGFAEGNYRLRTGSPCINTGTNLDWHDGAVDLDGRPRLDRIIRRVDMGCFEYIPRGIWFYLR